MKKLLILLSVIVITCVFSLCGCSSDEDTNAVSQEEEYTEEYTEEDTEVDAGMEELLVSYFPYDKEYWYVDRGNKTYTLNSARHDENGSYPLMLDLTYRDISVALTGIESVPLVLQKGDVVFSTFPREAPVLKLFKADFHGWGFVVSYHEKGHELNLGDGTAYGVAYDPLIEDEEGNVYEDPFNLEKDGTYKFSWNDPMEGYQYYEVYGNNRTYKLTDEWYEIKGTETENGRAEYDLSEIPPGIYRIDSGLSGGFIEIK